MFIAFLRLSSRFLFAQFAQSNPICHIDVAQAKDMPSFSVRTSVPEIIGG